MSDPVLLLAEQLTASNDDTPAGKLAARWLEERRDHVDMCASFARLYREKNALLHERDELREQLGRSVYARTEPKYSRLCANTECSASIVRDEPPPDEFVEQWLKGLGWSPDYCPRCKP